MPEPENTLVSLSAEPTEVSALSAENTNASDPADEADDGAPSTDQEEDALAAPAETVEDAPLAQSFAELNISARVLESLGAANFTQPTQIQAMFIPKAMTGQDVMGQARTGTGKTCAFLVPIFERIIPEPGKCQALILAPTRELALQITGEIERLGSKLGFSSITLYGGASYEPQIEALKSGVNIVVGTPGRVMDHMRSGRLDLSEVKVAVLDEADRMLDLGFRKDIEYILRHCPKHRQTLLLSATIPDDILRLAHKFMNDPLEVWTAQDNLSVSSIEQSYFVVDRDNKFPHLLKLLDVERPQLAIIFCGTKMGAKRLAEKLTRLHIAAREIHGDLQQSRREKIMSKFRTGKIKLLIATDVASRGIDVNNITHIINYDIPYKTEDYVHRVGRTGRIGKSGRAFTFLYKDEGEYLTNVELMVNHEIRRDYYEDLTSTWWPNPPATPDPDFHDAENAREGAADAAAPEAGEGKPQPGGKKKRRRRGDKDREGASGSTGGRSGGRGERDSSPRTPHAAPHISAPAVPTVATRPTLRHEEGYDIGPPEPLVYDVDGLPADTPDVQDGFEVPSAPQPEEATAPREAGKRRRSRNRGGRGRPGQESVSVTCSQCGVQTTVPFVPRADKPVFCQPCYKAHKAARTESSAGTATGEPAPAAAPETGTAQ